MRRLRGAALASSRTVARAIGDIRRDLGPLAAFEVGFHALYAGAFALGSAATMAGLAAMGRRPAVGNEEILALALSPAGSLALLALVAAALFARYVELAGLLAIGGDPMRGLEPSAAEALWRAIRLMPRLLELGLRQAVTCLLVAIPFGALAAAVYAGSWMGRDLNYLWTERPPAFWIGGGLVAALVVGYASVVLRLLIRWLLALPACLFEGATATEAMAIGARLARGAEARIAGPILAWAAILAVLVAAELLLLKLLGGLVLGRLGADPEIAVPAAAAILALHGLATASLSALASVGVAYLVLEPYCEARDCDWELDAETTPAGPRSRWPARVMTWAAVAVITVLSGLTGLGLAARLRIDDRLQITAHRGGAREAPENTIAAIRRAIAAGADAAEIDVQLSADGVPVVIHDTDLLRLAGQRGKVAEMTLAELRSIDVGRRFAPEFLGERIPTLEEAIDAARGRIRLNVELKFPGDRGDRLLAERAVEVIAREGFASRCVVSSLSYRGLQQVRRLAPGLEVGYIASGAVGDLSRLDVDFLSVRAPLATAALIRAAHARGKQVHAWTVDDPDTMTALLERGLDDVITDDPRALVARRAEIRALDGVERLLLKLRHALAE